MSPFVGVLGPRRRLCACCRCRCLAACPGRVVVGPPCHCLHACCCRLVVFARLAVVSCLRCRVLVVSLGCVIVIVVPVLAALLSHVVRLCLSRVGWDKWRGYLQWCPNNNDERRIHCSLFGCHVADGDVAPAFHVREEKGGGK